MQDIETWQVLLGVLGLLVSATSVVFTLALKYFGTAFKHWGNKFDSFQLGVNKRLDHMETNFATRLKGIEEKYNHNERKYHALTLHVERRVTWIEATLNNAPISGESPLMHRRRWYENLEEGGEDEGGK